MADYETMQNKLKGILADILGDTAGSAPSASPKQADPVSDILEKLTASAAASTAAAPAPAAAAPAGEADPIIGRPVTDILKVPEDQRILTTDKALVQKLIDSVVAQDACAAAAAPAPAAAAPAASAAKAPAEYGPKDPIIGRKPKDILKVPEDQRILTTDMSLVMQLIDSVVAQDGCAPADCASCKMACDSREAVSRDDLVKDVISEMNSAQISGRNGIYDTAEEAVAAAEKGYRELQKMSLEERERLIASIRKKGFETLERLAKMDVEETGYGRVEDKMMRTKVMLEKTPGTEDIKPEALAGDNGITLVERVPFGVACCITPSTGIQTTPFHNAICMIAAGNSVVFAPHPNAVKSSLATIEAINEAIVEAGGSNNIITSVKEVSFDVTNAIIEHPSVKLVVATGGPGIVKKVLSSGKKAIGAGAGNPPAFVDATADIPHAAKCIIAGNYMEYGIQCICEKECVVVDSVADRLIFEMVKTGAYLLKTQEEIDKLTNLVSTPKGPNKACIGKAPAVILKMIGIDAPMETKSIIFEAPKDHIIATDEFLMPIVPIVRVKDADEGIQLSAKYEGGRRHTAMVHSNDVQVLFKYAKTLGCTIIVKNAPSYAGVGIGGEGFITATIAGPTGEGITSPRTFTRMQRCALVGEFNLRGSYPY